MGTGDEIEQAFSSIFNNDSRLVDAGFRNTKITVNENLQNGFLFVRLEGRIDNLMMANVSSVSKDALYRNNYDSADMEKYVIDGMVEQLLEQARDLIPVRNLRAHWSEEAHYDLRAHHNMQAENELIEMLHQEINSETDREILLSLNYKKTNWKKVGF